MSAHTSGPWFVTVHDKWTDVDSKHFTIAGDVSNENANLIAAAPDLLAALEAMCLNMKNDGGEYRDCYIAARAAIAKATGAA